MATKKRITRKREKSPAVSSRGTMSAKPAQARVAGVDYLKFGESYTSLVLGVVVVIIAAILLVSFFRNNSAHVAPTDTQQGTSSTSINSQQQPQQTDNGQKTYTVKPGDNLWQIAVDQYKDGYQWVAIAKANNLSDPDTIHAGNKLVIPAQAIAQTVTPQARVRQSQTPSQAATGKIMGNSYTTQHGDDLWTIAVRAYGDGYRWVDIARANNLMNDPNLIFSGNKLTIPRG